MDARRLRIPYLICFCTATAITAGVYALDVMRTERFDVETALQLARQIGSQTESLTMSARERGDRDPLGWAIGFIGQGTEPRSIRVHRWQSGDHTAADNFRIDRGAGSFEYFKVLTPETSTGIKVQLSLPYTGFLGTRSKMTNDLAVFLCLALTYVASFFIWKRLRGRGTAQLRSSVMMWVPEFRILITQIGVHFRDLVREAHALANAARQSRAAMAALRDGIRSGTEDLKAVRESMEQIREFTSLASELAKRTIAESRRMGSEGKAVAQMTTELHGFLERVRTVVEKDEKSLAQVEAKILPWAQSADQAFQSQQSVLSTAKAMSEQILHTKNTLSSQVQMVKRLSDVIHGEANSPETSEHPSETGPALESHGPGIPSESDTPKLTA